VDRRTVRGRLKAGLDSRHATALRALVTHESAITSFAALHRSGCFVIPNPWDVGSAVAMYRLGFKALATTSAGFAFTRGKPDAVWALGLEDVLTHFREIAAATPLPVNADFQSGFAHEPDRVAANVALCVRTGVAGLSIEDATGDAERPLYERDLAIERVRAARRAIDASGVPVLLTARCEAWLVGDARPERTALDRLVAFAEAGADCLFAPGVKEPETIRSLVRAVAPKPLNVLVSGAKPAPNVAQLAELGVRRISVGSGFARVAWKAFLDAARPLVERGSFEGLAGGAPFAELNALFDDR
jgi:2-methylisocitrate lyase-like PEP mutase family enzyme